MTVAYGDMGSRQGIRAVENGFAIGGKFRFYTGDGAPSSNISATEIADLYVDFTNGALYMAQATGTASWMRIGVMSSSSSAFAINTANDIGVARYWSSTATSGTTYGWKNTLSGNGAGAEFIAGRDRCILGAAAGNAYGYHGTLEVKDTGYVTGQGAGIRGNVVFSTDTVVPQGTIYGILAEIYPIGNTGALPAASNACLGINAQSGTASDLTVNAIAVNGADASGKMIYTHGAGNTSSGSIRILVNGVKKYLRFYDAE